MVVTIIFAEKSFADHFVIHRLSNNLVEPVHHLEQVKHHAGDRRIAFWCCHSVMLIMAVLSWVLHSIMMLAFRLGDVGFCRFVLL